ncbi:PepSY domain-containing protein [Enterococcus sp. LJL99]
MKKIIFGMTILTTVMVFAGCSTNKKEKATESTSQVKQEITTSSESSSVNQNDSIAISLDQALATYDEQYPNTTIVSLELEKSFGNYYYKIEGVDNSKEYEISINATDGTLKKEREEALDLDEQNGAKKKADAIDTKNLLSIKEISQLAEKEIGKGKATEWKLEQELGVTYWEVKVVDGLNDYEVKINAKTGEILEQSAD